MEQTWRVVVQVWADSILWLFLLEFLPECVADTIIGLLCCAAFLSCVSPTMGTEAVDRGAADDHGRGILPQNALGPGGSLSLV